MKLHLPKILLAAVVAIVSAAPSAWAASSLDDTFTYAGTVYTLDAVPNNNSGILTNKIYLTEKEINSETGEKSWGVSAEVTDTTGDKWQSYYNSDDYNTLRITTSNVEYAYKFAGFTLGGLIVEVDGSSFKALSQSTADRGITYGKENLTASSYFGGNFTIDNSIHNGSAPGIALQGTQNWYIEENKTVTLSTGSGGIVNSGTWNLSGTGELKISDTITNNGSIAVAAGVSVTLASIEELQHTIARGWEQFTQNSTTALTYTVIAGEGNCNITSVGFGNEVINLTNGSFTRGTDGYVIAQNTTLANVMESSPATKAIAIQSGKVLTHSANTTFANTPALYGSGTYDLGEVSGGSASAKLTTVTCATTWTGTVSLYGGSSNSKVKDINFNDLGNANSTVEIKEDTLLAGYFAYSGSAPGTVTFNPKIQLDGTLELNDGYATQTYNFNGSVSGKGTFKTTRTGGTNNTYVFKGDISGWYGAFEAYITNDVNTDVKFEGNAKTVDIAITRTGTGAGTLDLIVNNAGNTTTFNKNVTVDAVSTTANSSVKLVGNMTTGSFTLGDRATLTLAGGSLNVTGSLTLNALSVDFSKYSPGTLTHTLVTSGRSVEGWGGDVAGSYVSGDSVYSTSISLVEGNTIELTYTGVTTTVTGWELNGTALTLNVDAYLCEGMAVNLKLLDEDVKNAILAKLGQVEGDPMVSITLQGSNEGGIITADKLNEVVFVKGDTGQNYWGEMVDGVGLMYNVERIPEPTTTTLSLLALSALAMRRRRK